MTIIRSPRTTPFTVLPNDALRNRGLSFRARGVLAYLLSMPDGWQTSSERLARAGQEGRDAIRGALRELEDHGYLVRVRRRQPDGRFTTETIVHDVPVETPRDNPVQNPETFPPPETGNQASVFQASKERTTSKDGASRSLNRTKERTLPDRQLCGLCAGSSWRVTEGHELEPCSCDAGTRRP